MFGKALGRNLRNQMEGIELDHPQEISVWGRGCTSTGETNHPLSMTASEINLGEEQRADLRA